MKAPLVMPKYRQIYLVLREQLREGRYDSEGMPGECALAQHFCVGRVTVRKAMEMLVADGLVLRRPGRGTWPLHAHPCASAEAAASKQTESLKGLLADLVDIGLNTTVRVLDSAVVTASSGVAEALRIRVGEPVCRSVRIRASVAGPLAHITTYVPRAVAMLQQRDLACRPMLVLLEESGVKLRNATQTVSAQLATPAVARHLDVPVNAALLAVTRVVQDVDGQPVQLLQGLYRPDRYHYLQMSGAAGAAAGHDGAGESLSARFH